ncbi:MAG TPA: hypothetical protein VEW48_20730 [Thermoanaerobaculia bacterium]|nr:hypothetical protein [Thermoanaerobaculia bacterium]
MIETVASPAQQLPLDTIDFYRKAMETLQQAGIPFLVGGAYAYARYTGVVRHTKDFDVFIHPRDYDRALEAFARSGCQVERKFPHWLGKAWCGDDFVDVIFSSGNGVARVDRGWFERAVDEEVLGMPAKLCPVEEMIWSKSFIMERERFDGADVAHLLHCRAADIDWKRLLDRFGEHGRVLLSHLVLFSYIYPDDAGLIPRGILDTLFEQVKTAQREPAGGKRLCRGPILSRGQYLIDIEEWGYRDARLEPLGSMTDEEIAIWTAEAREEEKRQLEKGH